MEYHSTLKSNLDEAIVFRPESYGSRQIPGSVGEPIGISKYIKL
jgi:hypothetical protein